MTAKTIRTRRLLCGLLLVTGLAVSGCRADDVACQVGDTPHVVAIRLLTQDTELAHPAVEISLPPSEHSVVVLRRLKDDVNTNYEGWVLVPRKGQSCSYEKYELPKMIEPPGLFDIQVEAVFAAAVAAEKERDLVVLYRYHRNGAENDSGYASYIYQWNGSGFESQPKLAERVVGLKTAAAVRSKLRGAN